MRQREHAISRGKGEPRETHTVHGTYVQRLCEYRLCGGRALNPRFSSTTDKITSGSRPLGWRCMAGLFINFFRQRPLARFLCCAVCEPLLFYQPLWRVSIPAQTGLSNVRRDYDLPHPRARGTLPGGRGRQLKTLRCSRSTFSVWKPKIFQGIDYDVRDALNRRSGLRGSDRQWL